MSIEQKAPIQSAHGARSGHAPIPAEDMLRAEVRVFQNAESSGFTTRAAPNHRSIRGCSGAS